MKLVSPPKWKRNGSGIPSRWALLSFHAAPRSSGSPCPLVRATPGMTSMAFTGSPPVPGMRVSAAPEMLRFTGSRGGASTSAVAVNSSSSPSFDGAWGDFFASAALGFAAARRDGSNGRRCRLGLRRLDGVPVANRHRHGNAALFRRFELECAHRVEHGAIERIASRLDDRSRRHVARLVDGELGEHEDRCVEHRSLRSHRLDERHESRWDERVRIVGGCRRRRLSEGAGRSRRHHREGNAQHCGAGKPKHALRTRSARKRSTERAACGRPSGGAAW